jgi:lipooligosaccharide transport system permease protein
MSLAVAARSARIYRRHWMILAFGVLEPVLYLAALGVGIGNMIGSLSEGYAAYVASGLLAVAAMNAGMNGAVQSVFMKLRFEHTYTIMLSTPLDSPDIGRGELIWATARSVIESAGFLIVVALLGLAGSPWAVVSLGSVVLIGFTFAALGLLVATFVRDWPDFQTIQLVMLPMFLFATTFYPVDVYPEPIQVLVFCLPLYHAIEVTRAPFLGEWHASVLISVAYLIVVAVVAVRWGFRRLAVQLEEPSGHA